MKPGNPPSEKNDGGCIFFVDGPVADRYLRLTAITPTKTRETKMTQAIITKYHGPTNVKGARVTARAWIGSATVSYDHALCQYENHARAARALVARHWAHREPVLHGGEMPSGHGYAFLMLQAEG
jgi:hypothetical protein